VAEQLADDKQSEATGRAERCVRMPEIMQPHAAEFRTGLHSRPRPLEIGARLFVLGPSFLACDGTSPNLRCSVLYKYVRAHLPFTPQNCGIFRKDF
jgi:hypothetical protein